MHVEHEITVENVLLGFRHLVELFQSCPLSLLRYRKNRTFLRIPVKATDIVVSPIRS